jgi:hypothetical protein
MTQCCSGTARRLTGLRWDEWGMRNEDWIEATWRVDGICEFDHFACLNWDARSVALVACPNALLGGILLSCGRWFLSLLPHSPKHFAALESTCEY